MDLALKVLSQGLFLDQNTSVQQPSRSVCSLVLLAGPLESSVVLLWSLAHVRASSGNVCEEGVCSVTHQLYSVPTGHSLEEGLI